MGEVGADRGACDSATLPVANDDVDVDSAAAWARRLGLLMVLPRASCASVELTRILMSEIPVIPAADAAAAGVGAMEFRSLAFMGEVGADLDPKSRRAWRSLTWRVVDAALLLAPTESKPVCVGPTEGAVESLMLPSLPPSLPLAAASAPTNRPTGVNSSGSRDAADCMMMAFVCAPVCVYVREMDSPSLTF